MKIAVYAISKNEIGFAERWVSSMSEADELVVLDTGSTDGTAERLRELGVRTEVREVCPWRFDRARNLSLDLVPEDVDVCVCTDLDEVFRPGWRAALEACWEEEVSRGRYRYVWSFREDGSEGVVFEQEKIHRRHCYRWKHPVHEILEWTGPGPEGRTVLLQGVQLDHHPDAGKSRAQYLPLLELAAAESPEDDRCAHYLGREYLFRRRWDDCIRELLRHLSLPRAVWRDERAASMRCIGAAYRGKGDPGEARNWYLRAVAEAPHLREPYIDTASLLYSEGDWEGVLYFTGCALKITERPLSYICEADSWGSYPHDLRAIAYYKTGRLPEAYREAELALAREPDNARLRANVEYFRKAI